MQARLNPYLGFRGNAREAMEFYRKAFGGKLTISTFKEFQASQDPAEDDKVMHAMLETDGGFVLMAADTPGHFEHRPGTNVSISLSGDDDAQLSAWFEKLSAGGTVQEPLRQAPWGDKFGMFTDRFGIQWLVNIAGRKG